MDPHEGIPSVRVPRAFRIVAGVLGVLLVLLVVPYSVIAMVSGDPEQTVHRFHNTAGGVSTLILAAALVALAWRPAQNAASMQVLVVAALVSVAAGLLAGDLVDGVYFIPVVFVAILYALAPWKRSVWRVATVRPGLAGIAVVAAFPAVAYALTQAALQRDAMPGDVHAQMHHFSGVALTALAMPATLLVAAIGGPGWRLVAWIAAAAFLAFGLAGLAYSSYVSAPDVAWSWASIGASVATLVVGETHARRSGTA
jgi:hypothetical protein